jgi:hypothetical protein
MSFCNCCGAENIGGKYDHDRECIHYEPMTDEEFDVWCGLPAGATKMKRESEEFNRIVNLYT